MPRRRAFGPDFLIAVRALVNVHHSIYPLLPPQGIYFEALVEEAFRWIKKPFSLIEAGGKNQPRHDLLVGGLRLSLKTETGESTDRDRITITKLCTTEREPWTAHVLRHRVLGHLGRYDVVLMLRAIWDRPLIHYQLVEIPVSLLRMVDHADLGGVGTRKGRKSVGGDVWRKGQVLFHVHFDGSDGKCQIRNLSVSQCRMLLEWEIKVG